MGREVGREEVDETEVHALEEDVHTRELHAGGGRVRGGGGGGSGGGADIAVFNDLDRDRHLRERSLRKVEMCLCAVGVGVGGRAGETCGGTDVMVAWVGRT